jgi:hypothetical protein
MAPAESSDSSLLQSGTAETFAEESCKAARPNVLLDFALEQTDASNRRPTDFGPSTCVISLQIGML